MSKRRPFHPGQLVLLLSFCLFLHSASGGLAPSRLAPSREDIVFLIDNSRNMQRVDKQRALPAAINSFLSHVSSDVRAALILFDDTITVEVPFTPVSGEPRKALLTGLEAIVYEAPFSNTAAGLERALYELQHNAREGAGRSIILVSLGTIDTGNEAQDLTFTRWLTDVLAGDAVEARIRIFCVAFSASADQLLLQSLAQKTGGDYYRYSGTGSFSDLFDRVASAIFSKPLPGLR